MTQSDPLPLTAASALTHALAFSLGPDIRVNAILPGWIETRPWQRTSEREDSAYREIDKTQHPVGRVGAPLDIAATISFLASESAGFITGQPTPSSSAAINAKPIVDRTTS